MMLSAIGALTPPAVAQSASKWEKRGQSAEAKDDYDTAYEDYLKAYQKDPSNIKYRTHYERMRFQSAVGHVEKGRRLRLAGDYTNALTEFLRALEIDPGNEAARQEMEIARKELNGQAGPQQLGQLQRAASQPEMQELQRAAGPIQLKPVSNAPITLHMVEDSKVIYQAIGKAAGLNVLFDPDYTSKRLPVDLTNVSLMDALRIVGTISGTFWKPITQNTIFVAQDTRTKRQELDQQAVQTFYLANASQQNDANEVLTALRNLLDPTVKVYLVPSQNAIVMRGTPDQLLLARKIIDDLDRARPEVVVDVAILEVNRDKARNIGISLPQSFSAQLQSSTANTSSSSSSSSTTGTNTSTTSGLTLNDLGNLNATNFGVTVGSATANLLLSDSDTRILQDPRMRATDGQKASLKIGQRIPVATGSYSAGAATAMSPLVQTQFQYLDVGVNIDMTPVVHYDNDVTLNLKIEVSSEAGTTSIGGISEPIISQKVIGPATIRLKAGEVSILGGILQKTDTVSVSGTPGLGEIPLLKFLFSSRYHEVATDEVVFMLIPHIVRESPLTQQNLRAIDTGTGQNIQLRQISASDAMKELAAQSSAQSQAAANGSAVSANAGSIPATSAAAAANTALAQMRQQAQGAPPASMTITPVNATQAVGSTFQMAVTMSGAHDVASVPMQVKFDPKVLALVNVDAGDMLSKDGQAVALVHRDDGNGNLVLTASRPPGVAGVNGQGTVCILTFKAIGPGNATVALTRVAARNSAQTNLQVIGSQATVQVK
ncbi:MAG: cohesin domain-containing protein [Acidobacteriaceae bacterium]